MFDVLTALRDTDGLLEGHFILKSGLHSDRYFNKDAIYTHPDIMWEIGQAIALEAETELSAPFDIVLGPAMGGVILSQWAAEGLKPIYPEIRAIYAEKVGGGSLFTIKRGYDKMIKNKRILIVEDIVTTGGSIHQLASLVPQYGGVVAGAVCLVNRGGVNWPWLRSLSTVNVQTWKPEDCPLCKDCIPVNKDVGHG